MLAQNGFAKNYTDAEYDANIKTTNGWRQQAIKCEKVSNKRHRNEEGSLQECVKAVKMIEESTNPKAKKYLASEAYNTGLIYYYAKHNKIKAYEYWFLAAKHGDKSASKNLSIMCKESPWACK